ncbi:MAG: hypothetical protein OEW21_17220 [Betaproteobacteria bacterium]|nr:hypothetical protein [Betaproteobacteria bacterium]
MSAECEPMPVQSARIRATAYAAILLCLPAGAATNRPRCHAYDGDTLYCGREVIRLQDVYAAELDQSGGREARGKLQSIIRSGDLRIVRHGKDRFGRTLADLYINGRKVVQQDIGPRAGRGLHSRYASRPR